MFVSQLNVYPVKGCRGVRLEECRVERTGLRFDRNWMVVSEAATSSARQDKEGPLVFLSQRKFPKLATVKVDIPTEAFTQDGTNYDMVVSQSSMPEPLKVPICSPSDASAGLAVPVRVWGWEGTAVDEGDACARWFSQVLGSKARLVRFSPSSPGGEREAVGEDRHYAPDMRSAFQDGYPFLVTHQTSLDTLGLACDDGMDRFRANVVLAGESPDSAGAPFPDDSLKVLDLGEIRPVRLHLCKPCTRCTVPTIDQRTGEVDARGEQAGGLSVAEALKAKRQGQMIGLERDDWKRQTLFGWNAVQMPYTGERGQATISVGDQVTVLEERQDQSEFSRKPT